MPETPDLLKMSRSELDSLFCGAKPGPIPDDEGDGTVIFAPARPITRATAKLAHLVAWKGNVFNSAAGELRNEVGPLGQLAIRAKVYHDESWFDGEEAIIIDYSRTSLVAHWIRDEIREVAPGLYLGIVYWGHRKILNFSLKFPVPGT